jgi:pimeloyl-ACP methyl ester carboxylesterase
MAEVVTSTAARGLFVAPGRGADRSLAIGPVVNQTTLELHRHGLIGTVTSPLHRRLIRPTILQPHTSFDAQYDRRWRHRVDGKQVKVIYVAPSPGNEVTDQPAQYLHGYNESPGASRLVARAIHDTGVPYLSFEPNADYTMDNYADAATELMQMAGRSSLIGVSMGGVYGTMAAERAPENIGNLLFVEPGSINGSQSRIGLATRTVRGGLAEMGRAYLAGNIKGGLNLSEGFLWAAKNVIRNPKNAVGLIDGIAHASVNGLRQARTLQMDHNIPSSMIIFDEDQTFKQASMFKAMSEIEAAYGNPFALPVLMLPGNHFTLATDQNAARAIADRSFALYQKQLELIANI